LEVTRKMRGAGVGSAIPIVALTSCVMAGDREKALAAGCTAFIEKPIDPMDFLVEIGALLSRGAALDVEKGGLNEDRGRR